MLDATNDVLYVGLRFEHAVARFCLRSGLEIGRVAVSREPVAAVLTPDRRLLLVANHLPAGAATNQVVAAAVTAVETASLRVRAHLDLPLGSVVLRGMAIAPDGRTAVVKYSLARFEVPTTQVQHGWMNDAAMSFIDLGTLILKGTILLDDLDRGAAHPWGMAWTEDGRYLCVSHSGTHDLGCSDGAGCGNGGS